MNASTSAASPSHRVRSCRPPALAAAQARPAISISATTGSIRDLGSTTYPVHGFIYQDATATTLAKNGLATAQNTAVTVAQNAANQMAAAVRPGSNPLQMLGQAAEATDRIAALLQAAGQGAPASDD